MIWRPIGHLSDPDEPEHLGDPADLLDLPLLEDLLHRPAWHAQAACRGAGVARFFPERGEPSEPAKAVCATCSVQGPCFDAGFHEFAGIWVLEQERQHLEVKPLAKLTSLIDPALQRATEGARARHQPGDLRRRQVPPDQRGM